MSTDAIQSNMTGELDTLDESLGLTIKRDLKIIGSKLKVVLLPKDDADNQAIAEWDLWGPLLLCLSLAVILSVRAPIDQASQIFTSIFVVIWAGSGVVTINAKLLNGHVSFFQSVCVLGYCIFPLVLAAAANAFIPWFAVRLGLVLVAFAWSTRAALTFLSERANLASRRALALYPVVLFYSIVSWTVIIS